MTIVESETLLTRQAETARIRESLRMQISPEERDRLYGTIALISRSAYNRGQFPDNAELTSPRETLKGKLKARQNLLLNRANFDFKEPFLEITTFESDEALNSLYNSMGMLEVESRRKTSAEIFQLIKFSHDAGMMEPQATRKPVSIIGSLSTW
jgi:hypothetical protein